MHRQYAERKQRLQKALQTTETLQAYQKDVQMQYKRLFVNYPNNLEQVVPTVDSIKSIACDKYNILKLIINRRITCNLYLPHTEGKKPGILFLCGHEMSSKATESYQKTAILLANNGFVVLVIDPSGQGERVQLLDEKGKNLTKGSTTEHTLLSMGAGLVGWNEVNEMLIDNTLCLNYLSARPEVDATKIGCIGNSGGGAQTSYLSAMDKRIKAAACCSWFTQRDRMFNINGPDDGCQYLWNEGRAQLEIDDYYIMQAPRPTLILAGKRDFIDYTGSQQAFEELKQVYTVLGQAQQAEYFAYDDGHGISQPKREVAVRFFRKYFLNDSTLIEEKDLKTLPDSMLRCTRSGQMLVDFPKEESLQMRNYQMTQYYERFRRSFDQHELDTCRSIVKQLLNLDPNPAKVKARLQSETRMHPLYEERNYIVMRKGEPDMPVRVMMPNNKCCRIFKAYILMCDSGITAGEDMALTDSIIQQGHSVILIDPRGIGETKDQADKNNKKYYSNDYRNAALSLFIGRPLLGQRVTDILSAIAFVDNERSLRNCRIELIAVGNIGVAAMHAAFLDSRVRRADIRNCLSSWKEIIENPTDKNHMNLLVPNVLRFYDLDNLRIKNLETP
jgi:dienelactone hydrolase